MDLPSPEQVVKSLMRHPDLARQVHELLVDLLECDTCRGAKVLECFCPGARASDVCGDCSGRGSYHCPDCT